MADDDDDDDDDDDGDDDDDDVFQHQTSETTDDYSIICEKVREVEVDQVVENWNANPKDPGSNDAIEDGSFL